MAWTIPDKGEGDNNLQSVMFQEYLDVLVAGLSGVDCVLSGCAITGGADMTPAVAKGAVLSNGTLFAVTAGDVTISAADGTNPRLDLIVVNNAGAKAVRTGTPAANPKPPARSANDVVLGVVYVPASDTSIETTKITDLRVFPPSPTTIYKQTTQRTQLNSTATVSLFSSGAGLVIPNGLFLTGKVLRVRMGGSFLHNSTTAMTVTVRILFGGTVIFQDATGAFGTTADADRMAWYLEFDLIAAANNLQRMHGKYMNAGPTVTAPTTGIGDIATDEHLGHTGIAGPTAGIAEDADAADRTLEVDFDMDNANANNGWAVDGITVELL
jgi:hypothetical protein